jgi:hypothetical protein
MRAILSHLEVTVHPIQNLYFECCAILQTYSLLLAFSSMVWMKLPEIALTPFNCFGEFNKNPAKYERYLQVAAKETSNNVWMGLSKFLSWHEAVT